MPNSSKIRKVSNLLYILMFTGFDFLISRTKCYNASTSEYIIKISKKKSKQMCRMRNDFKFNQFILIFIVFIEYLQVIFSL